MSVTVTVTEKTAVVSGFSVDVTVMTLVTMDCGHILDEYAERWSFGDACVVGEVRLLPVVPRTIHPSGPHDGQTSPRTPRPIGGIGLAG
jgi:hypothetical protein